PPLAVDRPPQFVTESHAISLVRRVCLDTRTKGSGSVDATAAALAGRDVATSVLSGPEEGARTYTSRPPAGRGRISVSLRPQPHTFPQCQGKPVRIRR